MNLYVIFIIFKTLVYLDPNLESGRYKNDTLKPLYKKTDLEVKRVDILPFSSWIRYVKRNPIISCTLSTDNYKRTSF